MKNFKATDFANQIDQELKKSGFANYNVRIQKQNYHRHYHFVINHHDFDMMTICYEDGTYDIGFGLVDEYDEDRNTAWLGEYKMFSVEITELILFTNKFLNSIDVGE